MKILTYENQSKELNEAIQFFKQNILKKHLYECSEDCIYKNYKCILDFDSNGEECGLVIRAEESPNENEK